MLTMNFLKKEWRFLFFGFIVTFWSGPGQTFFLSLFNSIFRENFSLSHGDFGTIYMISTLSSALLLIKIGALIDRFPLKNYTIFVVLGMIFACFFITQAATIWTFCVAIFLLRFFGQGLMSHVSSTSVTRKYNKERGRALAIVALGFPAAEAIMPITVLTFLMFFNWQNIWYILSILLFFTMLLPIFPLLKKENIDKDCPEETMKRSSKKFTVMSLLKSHHFQLLILTVTGISGIVTAILFHQLHIVSLKGWDPLFWSVSFSSLYVLGSIVSSFFSGFLIDRFTAKKIVYLTLLPLALGVAILALSDSHWSISFFMLLMGITVGSGYIIISACWAEIYGLENLGAIKAMSSFLTVIGSAFGPVIMGIAFDHDISLTIILFAVFIFIMFSSLLSWFVRYTYKEVLL